VPTSTNQSGCITVPEPVRLHNRQHSLFNVWSREVCCFFTNNLSTVNYWSTVFSFLAAISKND